MKYPFFPLYVGDYLRDTQALSAEEHGAYLLILMDLWTHGGARPLDHKALAKIARVSPKRWPRVWESIESFFVQGEGSVWHRRVDLELQKADQITQKRKTAGTQGGKASALKRQELAQRLLEQTSSRSHSHSHSLTSVTVEGGSRVVHLRPPTPQSRELLQAMNSLAEACEVAIENERAGESDNDE